MWNIGRHTASQEKNILVASGRTEQLVKHRPCFSTVTVHLEQDDGITGQVFKGTVA